MSEQFAASFSSVMPVSQQIAMSPLRRVDKQSLGTVGDCAYRSARIRLQALCSPGEAG
jgi:hypothetical protein